MKLNETVKNILSFSLRLGISAALLLWLFRRMDIGKMGMTIKNADPGFIAAAAIIFVVINFMLLWRWHIFIKAMGLNLPMRSVTRWFFIGLFGNLFLPTAIGGDIIKAIGLCRETDEKPKVLASIALDRLSGFASIVIVSALVSLYGYRLIQNISIVVISILVLTVFSIGIAAVLFNQKLFKFVCRIFGAWPKLNEGLFKMQEDMALLKNKKSQGFLAIGVSALNQIALAAMFYLVARALHTEIDFIYILIFSPLVCVTSSVPSIGGLGVREFGWKSLLAQIGISPDIAVSLSLISFIFMVAIGLFGGILYVAYLSPRRVQHYKAEPAILPKES